MARNPTATLGERLTRIGLIVLTGAVLLFLVAPILTIVPLSFSSGSFFYYPLPGLSLRWYQDFFTSSFWLSSLQNSLIIGISATVLATVLGTMAALGIWRARFPAQALVLAMLISPMVVPVVIIAVGVYFAFAPLGLTDGYLGLILAHATLGVPFVVITVLATLSAFDRTLLRAAESLGASQLTTFRRVMLPLILPGVASGAVFAFAASFDEVVVVLLMAGPAQRTLPRQMFAGINDNISLTIAAAATMLIAISLALMIAVGGFAAAKRADAAGSQRKRVRFGPSSRSGRTVGRRELRSPARAPRPCARSRIPRRRRSGNGFRHRCGIRRLRAPSRNIGRRRPGIARPEPGRWHPRCMHDCSGTTGDSGRRSPGEFPDRAALAGGTQYTYLES